MLYELIVVDNHDKGLSVHPFLDLFLTFADHSAAAGTVRAGYEGNHQAV